jgi:hypothetical protein
LLIRHPAAPSGMPFYLRLAVLVAPNQRWRTTYEFAQCRLNSGSFWSLGEFTRIFITTIE